MGRALYKISVDGFLYLPDRGALILRRSPIETFLTGNFELPGGGVDDGETPESTLCREFFEETGIDVRIVRPYNLFHYISGDGKTPVANVSYIVVANADVGEIKLSDEHDGFRWVNDIESLKDVQMSDEMRGSVKSGLKLLVD
jgi:8-oxo-dGTP diphosphatase